MQTRVAQQQAQMTVQLAEAKATQAEVEQGRQALLHDESAEAQQHLAEAYRRGEHSPGVAFMLARALQPRMAEQARFPASVGHMWSAAFSPDGRQVVTTDDTGARIWDASSHRLLFTLPHGDTVYDARYLGDGARLATAGGGGAVRIWDASSGMLVRLLRTGSKPVRYAVLAAPPDGRFVAAIDASGAVVHVWDTSSAELRAELRNDAAGFPTASFSNDARWLATSSGTDVRVFDTATWKEALSLPGQARALSWNPKTPQLAVGSADGEAAIWQIPGGVQARHLRELGESVAAIAFSPDGRRVAVGERRRHRAALGADVEDPTEPVLHARQGAVDRIRSSLQARGRCERQWLGHGGGCHARDAGRHPRRAARRP